MNDNQPQKFSTGPYDPDVMAEREARGIVYPGYGAGLPEQEGWRGAPVVPQDRKTEIYEDPDPVLDASGVPVNPQPDPDDEPDDEDETEPEYFGAGTESDCKDALATLVRAIPEELQSEATYYASERLYTLISSAYDR